MVHRFYAMAIRREQQKMSRLSGVLRLVGFSARALDKKGDASLGDAWSKLFKSFDEVEQAVTQSLAGKPPTTVGGKKGEALKKAKQYGKFYGDNEKSQIRSVITETGNAAANVFLQSGLPAAF